MNDITNLPPPVTPEGDLLALIGRLWPSPEYTRQVGAAAEPWGMTWPAETSTAPTETAP